MFPRIGWGTLLVVLALGILSAVWWGLAGLFDDAGRANDLAGILQGVITAAAVLVGGVYAAYKLQVFRDFAPHLSIAHETSHRLIGGSYLHIFVTATLHNNSKVKIDLGESFFSLQQIAPVSEEDVERLYARVFVDMESDFLQWPILDEVSRAWSGNKMIIEPGEVHREACEFIVSMDVESVIIYTYFYDANDPSPSAGWSATTVYNIVKLGVFPSPSSGG